MNKKLIALAVAAAIAPAAAMADSGNVTIYGVANMSVDQVSATGAGSAAVAQNVPSHGRVSSNNSYLGFKGSEDLGNGLSAIWQIESTIAMDGANPTVGSTLATRNTFLGLSSKTMGTALMGQHDTPYKLATGKLDIFADTLGDYNSIIGTSGKVAAGTTVTAGNQFDRRTGNTVAYITPTFSGLHGAIGYVFGENPELDPKAAGDADQQAKAWSLAAIYDNGPIFASLSWEKHTNLDDAGLRANGGASTDTDSSKGTKLGLGYKFGQGTKVGVVWEKLTADASGAGIAGTDFNKADRSAYMLNLAHTMAANTFKISYAKANDGTCSRADGSTCSTAGNGAKQWTLGVDHAMSKRTNMYVLYTKIDNSYDATNAQGGYYNFGANAVAGAKQGADPKAISLGMRHSF